jgi:hypothetical protein
MDKIRSTGNRKKKPIVWKLIQFLDITHSKSIMARHNRKILSLALPTAIACSLTIPTIAKADQCAYISKEQALRAIEHLEPGKQIYKFCELCGDKRPQPVLINNVSLTNVPGMKFWEIKVNGRGIDLAYTYVNYPGAPLDRGGRKFVRPQVNLALISNCPADSFSPIISVK